MKRSDISRYNRAVLFDTPLVRTINLSIAVLLAGVLAAVSWFVWRPLAETSGEVVAPIAAEASIVRDGLGVPHITAGSWEDALFLQGYATAQDRFWQMDMIRRLGAGEVAEILGPQAVDADREARRFRLGRLAEQQEQNLTPEARAVYTAYARGVNYYLETHRGRLPVEFALIGYEPRPWRIQDSLLAGLHMYRLLTTSWQEELRKLHMLEAGDPDKVSYLYPQRSGTEAAPGSNAWAISGAHTASGRAILASDPHLSYTLPSTWYMAHLKAPGLDVTGATLPGIPAVLIGHNRDIAWGMTNLEFDMQDLYRETIDLASGSYVYRGLEVQSQVERETVAVKDEDPIEAVILSTGHGPMLLIDDNQTYTVQWTAALPGPMDFPFLAINRARDWEEFRAALARFVGPAQNFVYADAAGNIGYHVAGTVPVRDGCAGDVPADGSSPECSWSGTIPFEDLPEVYNPPSGIIVSANQNPFPEDYAYPVAGRFAPTYRARQIRARLEARDDWEVPQMISVQTDVYSAFDHFLAGQLVAAWDRAPGSDEPSRQAVEAVRNWGGLMRKGEAAPMIVTLLYEKLRDAVAEAAAPGTSNQYGARMAPHVIERLLRERPEGWFADYDQLLIDSLAAAVERGEQLQGSSVARWDYGQLVQLAVPHQVLARIPVIGGFFGMGPAPMSGSPFTVKQYTGRLGPSFRMAVDFMDLDASQASITIGQSGQPLSPHYSDQWDAFYNGTSFPMQFDTVDAGDTLTVLPSD